jgi:CO/xanthine dehydrogenase FAD-binding subunit
MQPGSPQTAQDVTSADYLCPRTVEEALAHLEGVQCAVVAGGTDFYPALREGPARGRVLDISGISGARGVLEQDARYRIGPLTTWTDLLRTPLPPCFDGLKAAARTVGGVQIQNVATLAGNLCNASPAADGVPPLLALDAAVELRSVAGRRTLPLADFIVGNRRTQRRADELLTAVLVPKPTGPARSTFLKLGARRYLVISIAMVAALLEDDGQGRVRTARVAVGACSEVARRLPELERALQGHTLGPALGEVPAAEHLAPLRPIDDVRGTAGYRWDVALTLVRRALRELGAAQ